MFWCDCIIHHSSVTVQIFTFNMFSTDPENCHGMIILRSRYIVGQALSLSLFSIVSCVADLRGSPLAGTSCVDLWELSRLTSVIRLWQNLKDT